MLDILSDKLRSSDDDPEPGEQYHDELLNRAVEVYAVNEYKEVVVLEYDDGTREPFGLGCWKMNRKSGRFKER